MNIKDNSKRKALLVNSSLLVISFLFSLLIAELVIRVIGKVKAIDFRLYMKELKNSDRLPKELIIQHPLIEYQLASRVMVLATTSDFSVMYSTNSDGQRDKEYTIEKPRDKIRILAFGDSFTFGEGVEYGKRFTDIPENYFHNVEIINFGVPGYGLDQMLLSFVEKGLKYSPDYVILFVHRGLLPRYTTRVIKDNVVMLDNSFYNKSRNSTTTVYLNRDDVLFKEEGNFILKYSYFLSFVKYRITQILLKRKMQQYDKGLWEDILKENKKSKANKSRALDRIAGKDRNNFEQVSIEQHNIALANSQPFSTPSSLQEASGADLEQKRALLFISKFNEICRQNNIRLVVINCVNYGSMDFLNAIDGTIAYFDLNPVLKKEELKYRLSFTYDQHYNLRAHYVIGNEVIKILESVFTRDEMRYF